MLLNNLFYILSECSNRRAEGRECLCDYTQAGKKTNYFYDFEVCSFAALHNVVIRQLWLWDESARLFYNNTLCKNEKTEKELVCVGGKTTELLYFFQLKNKL